MKKAFLLTVPVVIAALAAQAATIIDTWSTEGGAWDPNRQPQFAQTGILNPDEGSKGGGKLINPEKSGIFESVFYTFFTSPTLTVSTDSVADKLQSVTLEIVISAEPAAGPVLKFNKANAKVKPTTVTEGEATEINGHAAKTRTYVWDVAKLGDSDSFSIEFELGNHAAFKKLQLIQTTAD